MTEEKIMLDAKFSGYDAHKKEHDDFKLTFAEYIRNYENDDEFALSTFTKFLKEWIVSHVAQVDKKSFESLSN
jgi:hemerythrin